MADDGQTLREVWDGKIPACFVLASDEEMFSGEKPEQFYLVLSRQTYFPLVTDRVQKHFLKYVDPDQQGEMWFEDEGVPLRWHYPIGVLFDLASHPTRLPWTLTVHFRNFPESELLHCPSKDAVESHFMSMVKEADFLKHRCAVINQMMKKDHKQLWQGLVNDKFEQFWAVNRKLMEHNTGELFRYIPFRIHQAEKPFVQTLFRPTSVTGEQHTLKDLLCQTVPELDNWNGVDRKFTVLIHGIQPSLDAPIHWLSEHLSYPDNFLHICLLPH